MHNCTFWMDDAVVSWPTAGNDVPLLPFTTVFQLYTLLTRCLL